MKNYNNKAIILFVLMLTYNLTQAKSYTITLVGEVTKSIRAKEITLWYWEDLLSGRDPKKEAKTIRTEIINGKFKIIIHPQRSNIYLNFGWNNDNHGNIVQQLYPYLFIAETNDKVFIKIDSVDAKYKLTFSGLGSAKYNCAQELSNTIKNFKPANLIVQDRNPFSKFRYEKNYCHELINEQLKIIEKYRNEMSYYVLELYKTDVLFFALNIYAHQLTLLYKYNKKEEKGLTSLISSELDWISNLRSDSALSFNTKVLENSAFLPSALVKTAMLKADLKGTIVEEILANEKNAVIRDRLLAQYFLNFSKSLYPEAKEKLYNQIMIVVNDYYCQTIIDSYYKNTAVGIKAYNFKLADVNGEIVRLSDFKGKIVFIDFWFVGCGNCAYYYKNIVKPVELKYKNAEDVVFISVSIDQDLEKWTSGIKSGEYTSEEIINLHCPDGVQNPIIKQFSIIGYPHPLIIDRDGNIFSDSIKELRYDGVEGLVIALEKALKKDKVRTAF